MLLLPQKRLLIVHDHSPALFDFALRLVGSQPTQILVARSQTGALEMAKKYQPSIIVVAASMTTLYGRSFISLLRESNPSVCIVVPEAEPMANRALAS
ncbi:MAG: hypothetical protein LAO20_16910 [Acidobacteriia bacterium]|jgi:DNA-binding NarL/FixJ family response regulator|nr:hypothetical protein [Terriglobia bacterium]